MDLGIPRILTYTALWATITGGVWALFARTETAITPEARTAVSRWLRNLDPVGTLANWLEVFAAIFDRVFGKRHLSWRCFSRSCIASCACVLIVTFVWGTLRPAQFTPFMEKVGLHRLLDVFLQFFIIASILNFVPDYISLLETRYVIRWMSRERSVVRILGFIAIDFAFTFAIAFGAYYMLGFVMMVLTLVSTGLMVIPDFAYMARMFWEQVVTLSADYPGDATFGIFFYSTFFTSVWVWLYGLSGFIVKLGEYLGVGFSWFRTILDIENKPLRSMGLVLNILITIVFLILLPFLR